MAKYIKNTTDQDVGPITHGGFEFILPAKRVSAVTEDAAKHFKTLYKVEAQNPEPPKWKSYGKNMVNEGGDGGAPVPPLVEVDASEWDGKTYAIVSRFQMDYTRVPNRNDLIRIAEERGVDEEFIKSATREGSNIDEEEIVEKINALPVPESVRFPETEEAEEEEVEEEEKEKVGAEN